MARIHKMISLCGVALITLCSLANTQLPTCTIIKPSPSNVTSTQCVFKDVTPPVSFVLNRCNNTSYCPIRDYTLETLDNTDCVKITTPASYKGYANVTCKASANCFSGNCVNNKCVPVAANQNCVDSSQCDYGFACLASLNVPNTRTCQPQIQDQQPCQGAYDCVNTHYCFKGKCQRYFSLPENTVLGFDESSETGLSLCTSGVSFNQVCVETELTKNPPTCKDHSECTYISTNKTVLNLANSCECTLTDLTDRQCRSGSADSNFRDDFVNITLYALANLKKCNAIERTVKCRLYYDQALQSEFSLINNWKLAFWLFRNEHRILGLAANQTITAYNATGLTESMTFSSVIPDPQPPSPSGSDAAATEIHSCPLFSCPSTRPNTTAANVCASISVNATNRTTNNVSLYKSCNTDTQRCGYSLYDFVTSNANRDLTCINRNDTGVKRFAGEECNTNADCVPFTCDSGKCAGNATGINCTQDEQCLVGTFCSSNTKVCTAQSSVGGVCTRDFDCANNLLCNNGKCINMFSLKNGESINATQTTLDRGYFCESGRYSSRNNICVTLNYAYGPTVDTNGLIACTPGTSCNYREIGSSSYNESTSLFCQCGFSATGKAYCPLDDTRRTSDMSSNRKNLAETFNNKCHTLNRANCYKNTIAVLKPYLTSRRLATDFHLFKDSPSCAEAVLGSSYLTISSAFLATIAAILLF